MAGEDEIPVRIRVDNSETGPGIDAAKDKIREFTNSVEEARAEIRGFKELIIEAFAIEKIVSFIEKMTDLGEQIERTATMSALSAEQAQTLGFAMELTGGHAEDAATVMARFDKNLLTASSGAGSAYEAFVRMGISLQDIREKTPYELIQLTADAFERMGPSIQRTADMSFLGGRSFIQLAGAFAEGSSGLQEFHDKMVEVGALLSDQTVANLAQAHQGIEIFGASARGTGASIAEALRPAIEGTTEDLAHFMKAIQDNIRNDGLFHEILLNIDRAALVAGAAIKSMAAALGGLGAIAYDVAHGNLSDIKNVLADVGRTTDEAWKKIDERMNASPAKIPKSLTGAQGGVGDNPSEQQRKAAQQLEIQMMDEKTRTAITLSNIELMTEKNNLAERVAAGEITKTEEIEQLKKLAEEEYTIDDAALNDKIAHLKEGTLEYQKAQDQRLILAAKFNQELAKLDQQNMQEQRKQFDQFFKSIQSGMDTMVQGILMGTQTWRQAMSRLFADVLIKFIQDMIIKPKLAWLESMFMQVSSNQAKNAAIVASDSAAAGAKASVSSGLSIAKIGADAAEAYSGVFAWAAPAMGPFAAIPAAAAFALVAAKQGLVGSFDTGTDYVPRSGLAMVHQGEAIIPANQNNGAGGGVTINIQAIDTQTGAQFLRNNAATIAQVISGQMRNSNMNLSRSLRHQ